MTSTRLSPPPNPCPITKRSPFSRTSVLTSGVWLSASTTRARAETWLMTVLSGNHVRLAIGAASHTNWILSSISPRALRTCLALVPSQGSSRTVALSLSIWSGPTSLNALSSGRKRSSASSGDETFWSGEKGPPIQRVLRPESLCLVAPLPPQSNTPSWIAARSHEPGRSPTRPLL
jgi:hypothetical protein